MFTYTASACFKENVAVLPIAHDSERNMAGLLPWSRFSVSSCTDDDDDDDDDGEGRINFSVALSPKTTRTRNNKLKQ